VSSIVYAASPIAEEPTMSCLKILSYADLKTNGIVNNRTQLGRLIENHDFPSGFLLSANSRRWTEPEIAEWLDIRRSGQSEESDQMTAQSPSSTADIIANQDEESDPMTAQTPSSIADITTNQTAK
jgi:hypothetical protein